MQQLRRITDRVTRTGQAATDQVADQLALGTAVAAGLVWFVQRNGGYNAVRKQVLDRVRDTRSRVQERLTSPE